MPAIEYKTSEGAPDIEATLPHGVDFSTFEMAKDIQDALGYLAGEAATGRFAITMANVDGRSALRFRFDDEATADAVRARYPKAIFVPPPPPEKPILDTRLVARKGKAARFGTDLLTDSNDYVAKRIEVLPEMEALRAEPWHPVPLNWISSHPYEALTPLGIDGRALDRTSAYRCPALGLRFNAVVPLVLMTRDLKGHYPRFRHHSLDMLADADWQWRMEEGITEPGSFARALSGSGFTECCLPSDGSHEDARCLIRLSNGDALIVSVWLWYNK